MATAQQVARFFLYLDNKVQGDGISPLKLQKLSYYAQGFYLAIHDEPLFEEGIEAWTHGPVAPVLYHEYKDYGSSLIPPVEEDTFDDITDQEKDLISEVYSVFGQFSAWKLRDMTHEEEPWLKHEEFAGLIPVEEMTAYFKTRIE